MNEPCRRYGLIGMSELAELREVKKHHCEPSSFRHLRDGSCLEQIPGNKLPGYGHSVPAGQIAFVHVHIFEATLLQRLQGAEDDMLARAISSRSDSLDV